MSGQIIGGHYKVIRFLSRGGFGETYVAEDEHMFNSRCLIKHLKPASEDPKTIVVARRLFLSEAQKLQQLGQHEQIPQLIAYFEENQEFYLVQEFIRGHPLSDELTPGKRLNQTQVVAFLENLLQPLSFVHEQNIVHRDIKPDNLIRRQSDNKIVLIDFGAVKEIGATQVSQGTTQLTVGIGTPGYMPSEQSMGKPKLCSDVYAVGVMAIQALTGLLPAQMPRNQEEEIDWRHLVEIDDSLAAVIERMVRYHFRDRYGSATEALEAVRQLQSSGKTLELPATIITPPKPLKEQHQLTLAWSEQGETRTTRILSEQPTKNTGTFRLGRDPTRCDLALSDPKISRLQAEVRFDSAEQQFYLRSLNYNNPPMVDGQTLQTGELPLGQNSSIKLGDTEFSVSAITVQQYPQDYIPTPPPINPNPSPPITTQNPSPPPPQPDYSPPLVEETTGVPMPPSAPTQDLSTANSRPEINQLNFNDVIAKTDVELKRLGWTNQQGIDYLIQTYGKRSRVYLTDEELLEFLRYLESLPNPAVTYPPPLTLTQDLSADNLSRPKTNPPLVDNSSQPQNLTGGDVPPNTPRLPRLKWNFIWRWTLFNAIAAAVSLLLIFFTTLPALVNGAILGTAIGVVQGWIFSQKLGLGDDKSLLVQWVLLNILIYSIGISSVVFGNAPITPFSILFGGLAGVLQLWLLDKLVVSTSKLWVQYVVHSIAFAVFLSAFGLIVLLLPLFMLQGATIVWRSRTGKTDHA